ncbi:MAG TPA: dihydrolipoamide acetyltransferase family protein, partial [Propionibacteriaceae bacterium]|nr:dihydrolipoamide acetyltransferase family protein [Propionibacteriaceae bacterium]
MREFTLPSLGADMDQGRLVEWLVHPGDAVHKGQAVAVVDTSKAAIDVEIWYDGVVGELKAELGQTIPVGAVMATIETSGEEPEPAAPAPAPVQSVSEPRARPTPPPMVGASHVEVGGVRKRVSPAARKLAEERGVDLAAVVGTGPLGAVTLSDIERAAAEQAARPAAPVEAMQPAERQALMRQTIAAAMSRSKREIPHYYLSETIPMARAVEWLAAENASRSISDRVLMVVVQLKAVARALEDFPGLNGFYVDGAFRPAPTAHIGVAIALRQGGLVAPAIHDVASKDLPQLMRELSDLVTRTRAGSLRGSELADPTITVTNLGDQGVETAFGIISPP